MKAVCFLYRTEIYKDAEVDCWRRVQLPFIPFPGLRLVLDTVDGEDGCVVRIDRVEYYDEYDTFGLYEKPDLDRKRECPCTPESACPYCVFPGKPLYEHWEIEKVRRGDERFWLDIPSIFPTGAVVTICTA